MLELSELGHEVGYPDLLGLEVFTGVVVLRGLADFRDDRPVTGEAFLVEGPVNRVEVGTGIGLHHIIDIVVGIGYVAVHFVG